MSTTRHNLAALTLATLTGVSSCDRLSALALEERSVVLDAAAGVRAGDEVRIAGVQVGRVMGLAHRHAEAVVTVRVDERAPLFIGACGVVAPKNSFGPRHMILEPGDMEAGPLPRGQEIFHCAPALDLPQMLDQFKPMIELEDGPTYAETARSLKTFNGLLRLIVGDEYESPKVMEAVDSADKDAQELSDWIKDKATPIGEAIVGTREVLEHRLLDAALSDLDARSAKMDRELPGTFDKLEADIRSLEDKLDKAASAEAVAARTEAIHDTLELLADVKKTLNDITVPGKDALRALDDAREFSQRALMYDERLIREIYQVEGYRSYLGDPPREAREALKRAGVKVPKAPGWRD